VSCRGIANGLDIEGRRRQPGSVKREERKETSTHTTIRTATRIVMPLTLITGNSPGVG
jgi:hypothetical protein